MLVLMKRTLFAVAAMLILGACASDRYYSAGGAGSGDYYIAETPASIVHYQAAYSPLLAYGMSPWWGYSYYSPYYYPHYFSVWYAPWPYYEHWPYYPSWYAGQPGCCPPYRHHRHHRGFVPGTGEPGAPPATLPGFPVGMPAMSEERRRILDDRSLRRELRYGGATAPMGSFSRPSASMGSIRSAPGGRTSAGMASGRNPDRHDQ